jgi:hypothetical protein
MAAADRNLVLHILAAAGAQQLTLCHYTCWPAAPVYPCPCVLPSLCRHPSTAATVSGLVARIPMQLQEHRGRLTIALDLDETLLCTYRIEDCAGGGDTLQLVPANRPGTNSPSNSGGGGLSWFSSLGRTSSGGGSAGSRSSRGSSGGSSLGSYSVSTQWLGLPGELGVAARASAWMHYIPPAPSARTSSSSSSDGSMDSLPPPQQLPGPHSLAVFLRPGCREFLCQLACFAEVVLFTAALPQYGAPLAELLDPSGKVFRGRLYADACTNRAGRRGVKDLQVGRLHGRLHVEWGQGGRGRVGSFCCQQ